MVKHTFIYLIVIVLIGVAAWFFVKKSRDVSNNSELASVIASEEPSPTATMEEDKNTKESDWTKLPNGLQLRDLSVGYGREAKEGDAVSANYVGTLSDGTKFDSSYDRGQPFSFMLGGGMVIKGWDIGLVGMKVGGKRSLVIPPDLGYGDRGAGNIIPPNATLYFDVELVDAQTPEK